MFICQPGGEESWRGKTKAILEWTLVFQDFVFNFIIVGIDIIIINIILSVFPIFFIIIFIHYPAFSPPFSKGLLLIPVTTTQLEKKR